MSMLAIRMGIAEATSVVVIDPRCGGRCRGMLAGPPQSDTGGMHGFAAATDRRGNAGDGCGGMSRTQVGGSKAGEETDGRSGHETD